MRQEKDSMKFKSTCEDWRAIVFQKLKYTFQETLFMKTCIGRMTQLVHGQTNTLS